MTTYEYCTDTSTLNDHISKLKQILPTAIIDFPPYDIDDTDDTFIHVTTDNAQKLFESFDFAAPDFDAFIKYFTYNPDNCAHLI